MRNHEEKIERANKLARFFQENNSSLSTVKSYKKKVDKERDKHGSHVINIANKKDKHQKSAKHLETLKETKDKYHTKHSPKIKAEEEENQPRNETASSNTTDTEINKTRHNKTNKDEKKQKAVIRQMLCELFNISRKSEACKDMHHSKKAMIWPTKMIPWLRKVLINKLNRGFNDRMSFMDNLQDPTEPQFNGRGVYDNWDGNPFLNVHRKHRHGLKMVPLLKSLKAKLYGQKAPGDFGSLNDALNGEGLNGFGPMPTQGNSHLIRQVLGQALGGSDRNSVLNEMMQEFLLANNREENEGNEGFADFAGRNSLNQLNNGLQSSPVLPEPSQGIGMGQLGAMNMFQGNMRTPLASEQPIHAQMLDNGAIAPMSSQSIVNSPSSSFFGDRSPIDRSGLTGSPLRMSSMSAAPISSPTSRSSQLQNSVLQASQRGGSLLQRAGGFDTPISSSVLERTANPTQRMYTEGEGVEQDISSQEGNFIERDEANEKRLPLHQRVGNNMIMEEISDNMARGVNLPMQNSPDLNRMLKLRSNFRSTGSPSISKVSRLELDNTLEHGLRLPVAANTMGMASVLSKDEDAINFEDLNNERSLTFRREKVLRGTANSHLLPNESKTNHAKASKAKND